MLPALGILHSSRRSVWCGLVAFEGSCASQAGLRRLKAHPWELSMTLCPAGEADRTDRERCALSLEVLL